MVYGFNLICIHGWISFQDRKMVFIPSSSGIRTAPRAAARYNIRWKSGPFASEPLICTFVARARGKLVLRVAQFHRHGFFVFCAFFAGAAGLSHSFTIASASRTERSPSTIYFAPSPIFFVILERQQAARVPGGQFPTCHQFLTGSGRDSRRKKVRDPLRLLPTRFETSSCVKL